MYGLAHPALMKCPVPTPARRPATPRETAFLTSHAVIRSRTSSPPGGIGFVSLRWNLPLATPHAPMNRRPRRFISSRK